MIELICKCFLRHHLSTFIVRLIFHTQLILIIFPEQIINGGFDDYSSLVKKKVSHTFVSNQHLNLSIHVKLNSDDDRMKDHNVSFVFSSLKSTDLYRRRIISHQTRKPQSPVDIYMLANRKNLEGKGSFVCVHSVQDQKMKAIVIHADIHIGSIEFRPMC